MGKILLPAALIGVGLAFIILSVIMGFVVVPNIIDTKIEEEVSLVEESETWEKWRENPVPIYIKFYIFNVTNPDEVVENGTIPELQELGPYVFREHRVKHIMGIDEVEDTITYNQTIHYYFEEEMSSGSIDDRVNIVNLPLMAIATNIYGMLGSLGRGFVTGLVNGGETIVKKNVSVGELTFEGYPILPAYGTILSLTGSIPPEFQNDSFGFYKGKNGTDDGVYVINAGIKDTTKFGKILSWNNEDHVTWWSSPANLSKTNDHYCNAINGTDGGIFAPFVEKDSIIRIFVTDICRSIHFVYEDELEHEGITGYKFGFPEAFYQDPKINGDNYCFCPSPSDEKSLGKLDGSCTQGVIRIFPCQNGAPLVTSSPHFHKADPSFLDKVHGLNPIEGEHDTYAVLEPNSGMLLKISKKLQISVEMQNFSGGFEVEMLDRIDNYLFPIFWADESADLDEENANDLKAKLLTPLKIVGITKWIIIALGALLVAGGIGVVIKRMS